MKKKLIIVGLAVSSIGFSQALETDLVALASFQKEFPFVAKPDTTSVDTVTVKVESKVCGENTSKNTPCKNKTKHESGKCHYHRD